MKKYVKMGALFVMCGTIVCMLYVPFLYFGEDPSTLAEQPLEWTENVTRNLYPYVQPNTNTVILSPTDVCSTPLQLLIVVCTRAERQDMRDAIRSTWGAVPDGLAARVVFMLGESHNTSLQAEIRNESAAYGDIVQESFLDTYNNLTIKTMMMLKWMTSYCRDVEFLVKTDDDMFVNIPALARLVTILRPGDLLMGHITKLGRVVRAENSKWYIPTYMYPWKYYPPYLSGVTYVMSNDVAYRLYEAALNTPLIHLEDVYLTGIVASMVGIRRRDSKTITYERVRRDPCIYRKNRMVAYWHGISAEDMKTMWALVKNEEMIC